MNDMERHIFLSWNLIEHKIRYYVFDDPSIEDSEFDKLEQEYLDLCEKLKEPNTVQSMVGIDLTRPSVQEALKKVTRERNQ